MTDGNATWVIWDQYDQPNYSVQARRLFLERGEVEHGEVEHGEVEAVSPRPAQPCEILGKETKTTVATARITPDKEAVVLQQTVYA